MPEPNESLWGRWRWKDTGLGRWHAIAEYGQALAHEEVMPNVYTSSVHDVVRLACGRIRTVPHETGPRPPDEQCCPECRTLDDMRRSYTTADADAPRVAHAERV